MGRSLEEIRRRVYESIDGRDVRTRFERFFVVFISTLIVLNVVATILETLPAARVHANWLRAFEVFSVIVFAVEYLTRLWSCTADPRFRDPVWGRVRFVFSPLSLLDLAAILSIHPRVVDLWYLRLFRLARFLRIFKLGRYSESLRIFGRVYRSRRSDLALSIAGALLLIVVVSCLLFYAEEDVPNTQFRNIPATMWMVLNLTTVGYEELRPVTAWGRVLAVVISLLAIAVFALPAGIIASGFSEEMDRRRGKLRRCPHCGKALAEE